MAPSPPAAPADRWASIFALSLLAVVLSIVVLAMAVLGVTSEDETSAASAAETPAPGEAALPEVADGLTYSGMLPAAAQGLELKPAASGKTADIEFAQGSGEGAVATRYFVAAASLGAGVDALSADELRRIWSGEIGDWGDAGGIAGAIRPVVASEADAAAYAGFFGAGALPGDRVDGYSALRAEMSVDSGIIAIVPIEELSAEMVALAIDGSDLARGKGDPVAWPLVERLQVVGHTKKGRDQVEAIAANITAKLPTVTSVVATGDLLQSRCSLSAIRATGDWGAALRGPVGEYLAAANLALSSLDGSIQGIAEPYGCVETTNLTSPPEVIEAITLAGIDGMTVATNHAFDCAGGGCGSDAMLESITRLNAVGVKTVGGGKNLEEALAPAIFEVNRVKFGVLGFDDIAAEDLEATETEPGTAPLDDSYENERADAPREPAFYKPPELLGVTRLEERIRKLKSEVDVVIVQIQSGTEDTHTPSPRSIKALRAAAAAGADLVVGNQAHWVQAIEVRDGTFVAYALGNFVFDQVRTAEHMQGYLLEATFHGSKLATTRMVPYQIEGKYKPTFVEGATRTKILGDVIEAALELP